MCMHTYRTTEHTPKWFASVEICNTKEKYVYMHTYSATEQVIYPNTRTKNSN